MRRLKFVNKLWSVPAWVQNHCWWLAIQVITGWGNVAVHRLIYYSIYPKTRHHNITNCVLYCSRNFYTFVGKPITAPTDKGGARHWQGGGAMAPPWPAKFFHFDHWSPQKTRVGPPWPAKNSQKWRLAPPRKNFWRRPCPQSTSTRREWIIVQSSAYTQTTRLRYVYAEQAKYSFWSWIMD